MMMQTPRFKTEAEYDHYSFKLSQQLKSIKLNALRTAMARADGFERQEAYRAFIRKYEQANKDAENQFLLPVECVSDMAVFMDKDGLANTDNDPRFDSIRKQLIERFGSADGKAPMNDRLIETFGSFAGSRSPILFGFRVEPLQIVYFQDRLYLDVSTLNEGLEPEDADQECIDEVGQALTKAFGGYYMVKSEDETKWFRALIPMDYLLNHEISVDELSEKIFSVSNEALRKHSTNAMIRTKGLIDGCTSLKEAAARCMDSADAIDTLAASGAVITNNEGADGFIFVDGSKKNIAEYMSSDSESGGAHTQAFKAASPEIKAGPEDGEFEMCLRCKWLVDGPETLEEIAENIRGFARYLIKLNEAGLEIGSPTHDDYLFLYTDDKAVAKKLGMNKTPR